MITGKTRTKRVNIVAHVAIRNITPPIYGTLKDVVMTTGDILKCLSKRAKVEEILPDGSTIRLNFSNYYTDNGAGLYVKQEEKARSVKVPEAPVVKNEAPVVETKVEIIPEDNHVEAIIVLPRNMFYATDISVTLWIMGVHKKEKKVIQVLGFITKVEINIILNTGLIME